MDKRKEECEVEEGKRCQRKKISLANQKIKKKRKHTSKKNLLRKVEPYVRFEDAKK